MKEADFYPDDGSSNFKVFLYIADTGTNPYFSGPVDDEKIVQTVIDFFSLFLLNLLH